MAADMARSSAGAVAASGRRLYILPFTRRAARLVGKLDRRGPLVIIGSRQPIASRCRELGRHEFMSPYEVHRHVRAGGARRTFVSFPEMVGAGTASAAVIPFAGELLAFSTIELWLVLEGFRPYAPRTSLFGYRLRPMPASFDEGDGVEARIQQLFALLEHEVVNHAHDHLYPAALHRKTAAGTAAALVDAARDMTAIARLMHMRGVDFGATRSFVSRLQEAAEAIATTR
jgi:hypothetical protein